MSKIIRPDEFNRPLDPERRARALTPVRDGASDLEPSNDLDIEHMTLAELAEAAGADRHLVFDERFVHRAATLSDGDAFRLKDLLKTHARGVVVDFVKLVEKEKRRIYKAAQELCVARFDPRVDPWRVPCLGRVAANGGEPDRYVFISYYQKSLVIKSARDLSSSAALLDIAPTAYWEYYYIGEKGTDYNAAAQELIEQCQMRPALNPDFQRLAFDDEGNRVPAPAGRIVNLSEPHQIIDDLKRVAGPTAVDDFAPTYWPGLEMLTSAFCLKPSRVDGGKELEFWGDVRGRSGFYEQRHIGQPLAALAWVESGADQCALRVGFVKNDRLQTVDIDRSLLLDSKALGPLLAAGYRLVPTGADALRGALGYVDPKIRIRRVNRPGRVMSNDRGDAQMEAFALPNGFVAYNPLLGAAATQYEVRGLPGPTTHGTLQGQMEAIETLLSVPDMPHFHVAFVMGFAGTVVEFIGDRGFTFILSGNSSLGKSAATKIAASICGNPNPQGAVPAFRALNGTSEGLMLYAEGLSGSTFGLDEVRAVHAEVACDFVYRFSEGSARLASTKDGGMAKRASAGGGLAFLNAEKSLSDMAALAGIELTDGIKARSLSLRLPSREHAANGIPVFSQGPELAKIKAGVDALTYKHSGHLGAPFLRQLMALLTPTDLAAVVNDYEAKITNFGGVIGRKAKVLAIWLVTRDLLRQFNWLPKCFDSNSLQTLLDFQDGDAELESGVSAAARRIADGIVANWGQFLSESDVKAMAQDAREFRHKGGSTPCGKYSTDHVWVTKAALAEWVGDGAALNDVLNFMHKKGMIRREYEGARGNFVRRVTGVGGDCVRFYRQRWECGHPGADEDYDFEARVGLPVYFCPEGQKVMRAAPGDGQGGASLRDFTLPGFRAIEGSSILREAGAAIDDEVMVARMGAADVVEAPEAPIADDEIRADAAAETPVYLEDLTEALWHPTPERPTPFDFDDDEAFPPRPKWTPPSPTSKR